MTVVVDASVAIKWFLPELHDDAALRLLRAEHRLVAPDLLFPEVGNVLWKRVRRREATASEAGAVLDALVAVPLEVHASQPMMPVAFEIACATGRTVYDSLYVALAVLLDCRRVTADERLYNALKDGPLGAHILWVEDDLGMPAAGEGEIVG